MSMNPIANWFLRVFQLVFGLVAAMLFGIDLRRPTGTANIEPDAWMYAEMVIGLSIITSAVHFYKPQKHAAWNTWEWVLFVLWAVMVIYLAHIYLLESKPTTEDEKTAMARLRAALLVEWLNSMLWLSSAVYGTFALWNESRRTSDPTRLEMQATAGQRSSPGDSNGDEQDRANAQKDSNPR